MKNNNKVTEDKEIVIAADSLRRFVRDVFVKLGVPPDDAYITADVLVRADLRGIESHGVARLGRYVNRIKEGLIAPVAHIKIAKETPSTLLIDGGNGLGQVISYRAMEMCIRKADENNVAFVVARNSNHFGIAGYYAMMALPHNMIGICMTSSRHLAMATYGKEKLIGTNPISFVAPAGRERPFVLDMATTVVPIGKIEVAQRKQQQIPLGWAVNEKGEPTTSPDAVLKNGGLMPLGGTAESSGYKGYGLSVMIDILCGVLGGSAYLSLVERSVDGKPAVSNLGHFFGAIKITAFRDLDEFTREMDNLIRMLKGSAKVEGETRIFIAGEKEFEKEEEYSRCGIPIDQEVFSGITSIGKSVGVGW
ncbi:MAG: Ldh family oxidoreductase [Planctomycetota bacterium]|nr:Ldh family oxidoreductase [Planctomycetota bacterium]